VLRMKPKMKYNDPTAHAIDREFRIMKALKSTNIPGVFIVF
jgi:aminoglycoside phosphotransferase (APT) family kinase protein